jgi:hypothetical protein
MVGGRTEGWMDAHWNSQKLILLSHKHRLSYLVALQEHEASGHLAGGGGKQLLYDTIAVTTVVVPLENIRKQLLRAVVTAEFGWSLWKISKSSYYGP